MFVNCLFYPLEKGSQEESNLKVIGVIPVNTCHPDCRTNSSIMSIVKSCLFMVCHPMFTQQRPFCIVSHIITSIYTRMVYF